MMQFLLIAFIAFSLAVCRDYQILVLSDFHYNEDYADNVSHESRCTARKGEVKHAADRAPWGRYLCDSPYSLIRSSILKAKSVLPRPDAVLVLGDLVAHKVTCKITEYCDSERREKIRRTITNVTKEISRSFRGVPVLHTMGNHDSYYHNQVPRLSDKSEYYKFLYNTFIRSHPGNHRLETKDNIYTFMNGGYYYYDMNEKMRIIVVNSMHFFKKNEKENDPWAGKEQMKWIRDQLRLISRYGRKAIILMHVPNDISKAEKDKRLWRSKFHAGYEELLKEFGSAVELTVTGHLHIARQKARTKLEDEVRAVGNVETPYGSIITDLFTKVSYEQRVQKSYSYTAYQNTYTANSITPLNYNNPSFSIITLNSQLKAHKITVHSFDLAKTFNTELQGTGDEYWSRLYDTESGLGMANLSAEELVKLHGRMMDSWKVTLRYVTYMMGHHISYKGMYYGLNGFHAKKYLTPQEAGISHVCPFDRFEQCVLED
eukprot:TRINITY_DN6994_c0_g1_i22.p1 TRINITY_DN6994_c0_g1~~TRINITY_DN6994_c0_g1_i22.p1  ORF type:complete len:487 (+),score=107.12 TRINITY_DN6994_c0_g1_i22:107-1567(+)